MLDDDIADIASRQHGVFSRAQALAAGATNRSTYRRLGHRRWVTVAPGVYSLPGFADSWVRRLWIAHLDAGPQSVVSHEAAAALHRLLNYPPGPIRLIAPHGDHHRPCQAKFVHQSRDIAPAHVTRIGGLPVTTIPRTFCDLAATSGRGRLERAIDDAHLTRRCAVPDIVALANDLQRPGKRGLTRLLALLDVRGPGVAVPESELERALVKLLQNGGFTGFSLQHELPWRPHVPNRVDVLFAKDKAIVEADSRRWHGRVDAMAEDRRRDRDAQNHGYRVYRFLHEEVIHEPDEVRRVLRAALSHRALAAA